MARRLLLTRFGVENIAYQSLGAYRLRVECSDPSNSGADPNVFLYLRRPVNQYTNEADDDFQAIASPPDMAEYPIGEPNDATTYPFFRLDYLELDFRALSQVEEVWPSIVSEVAALLTALDQLDELTVIDTTWIGAPRDTGDSESQSDSSSVSV